MDTKKIQTETFARIKVVGVGGGGCNAGGDANCEWFTQDPDTGTKTLINDPAGTVKAWIARTVPAAASMIPPVVLGGGAGVGVSWTGSGELEMALSINGPWVKAQLQNNPSVFPVIPGAPTMFFRVRTY